MKEIKFKGKKYKAVKIEVTPNNILREHIVIGECTNNSVKTKNKNPTLGISYVEGALLLKVDGRLWAEPHAWNALDGHYFDVTAEELREKLTGEHKEADDAIEKYYILFDVVEDVSKLDMSSSGVFKFSKVSEKFFEFITNKYPKKVDVIK